jgi:hypothetical protein
MKTYVYLLRYLALYEISRYVIGPHIVQIYVTGNSGKIRVIFLIASYFAHHHHVFFYMSTTSSKASVS